MTRLLSIICFLAFCYSAGFAQSAEPFRGKALQNQYSKPIQIEGQKSIQKTKKSEPSKLATSKEESKSNDDAPAVQENENLELNNVGSSSSKYLQDPVHWFNSYTDKRNASLSDDGVLSNKEQEQLGVIIAESKGYISNSFEFNYINVRHNRNKAEAGKYLQEAINSGGFSNSLLLPEIAWISERLGDVSNRNLALSQYEKQGFISAVQNEMALWSLNIAESGSLIVTNGEFDTYPLWLQQQKKSVFIVSLAMLEDSEWLSRTLKSWNPSLSIPKNLNNPRSFIDFLLKQNTKPVYLSLSIRSEILASYTKNLHPIGPLARLTSNSWNSTDALSAFYFNASFQKFLNSEISKNDPFVKLISNLLPGIYMLKSQLLATNDPREKKAEEIYQQIKSITGKSIRP
jgi:hypothetical protein